MDNFLLRLKGLYVMLILDIDSEIDLLLWVKKQMIKDKMPNEGIDINKYTNSFMKTLNKGIFLVSLK